MLPSERELCSSEGLSRTTVRRAIQQLVDERIVYRIPGSGTYVGQPPQQAGAAAPREHATIGMILPSLANPYFGELATAIERECTGAGYQMLLGQSDLSGRSEVPYLARYVENAAVKGVITIASDRALPVASYQQLTEAGKPFVFVVRQAERLNADSVSTDHLGGSRDLTLQLIAQGHRRIAYVGQASAPTQRHLQGYREALREAGIPEDPALQSLANGDALDVVGELGARALIERGVPFTAIFAQIDMVAIGVLRTLRAAGISVPADVSVVGFDNIPSAAHLDPPLTTVDHTIHEIGRLAVLLLQDRITGRYDGPARRVTIQPRIIVRASSGPPPAGSAMPGAPLPLDDEAEARAL
jgi:DNA-binding LacI/PurR family transcriptional regulator